MTSIQSQIRPVLRRIVPANLRHRFFVWLIGNTTCRCVALRLPGRARVGGGHFTIDVGLPDPVNRMGIWLGVHESAERELVREHVVSGLPIVELGAGIGTVSFVASKSAASPKMLLVEANPRVAAVLRRNMRENHVDAEVIEAAIAYGADEVVFDHPEGYWVAGEVSDSADEAHGSEGEADDGRLVVPARTLAELIDGSFDEGHEFQLICDIEGMEWQLFDAEADLIRSRVRLVIAELHGDSGQSVDQVLQRGRSVLEPLGFAEAASRGPVAVFVRM